MKRSYYLIRIIPFTLAILVCLYVFGMSIQVTGYTDLHRMRTAEKAHMVGPSTLMGQEKSLPLWGDVMIGESEYGYTLFFAIAVNCTIERRQRISQPSRHCIMITQSFFVTKTTTERYP